MKKCKLTKNLAYIAISFMSIVVLSSVLFSMTRANPDYICIKNVSGQSCSINSCGAWQTNGTRICYGTRTTKVGYYLIRTSCEDGYSQVSAGGNVGGDSGRQGGDYVIESEGCNIIQEDHKSPAGVGNTTYQ